MKVKTNMYPVVIYISKLTLGILLHSKLTLEMKYRAWSEWVQYISASSSSNNAEKINIKYSVKLYKTNNWLSSFILKYLLIY